MLDFFYKLYRLSSSVVMTFDFSRLKSNDAKVESRIYQKPSKSNEIRLFRLFHIQRKKIVMAKIIKNLFMMTKIVTDLLCVSY